MADIAPRIVSVDADMRGIFGAMERRRAPRIAPAPTVGPVRNALPRPQGRVAGIVALVVVILAGGATLAFLILSSGGGADAPAARETAAAPVRAVAVAPKPVPSPSGTVVAGPPAHGPPAVGPAPAAEPTPVGTVEPAPRSTALPARRMSRPRPPAAQSRAEEESVDIAPAPGARRDAAQCWRDPTACSNRDVLTADQRLVRAYQRAREAGVPTPYMRAVRRRWVRALDRSEDDPGEMIATYNGLVDELDDARESVGRPAR